MYLKAEEPEGVITARFATLDVLDHDGDVIRPKAIGKQKVNAGLYNHLLASPTPAGYGDTYEEDGAVYATIQYITDTFAGRETYTYLKAMADAKRPVEWSMAFNVTKGGPLPEKDPLYEPNVGFFREGPYEIKKMDIVSIDPVGRGAGINTATVEAKGCDGACEARRQVKEVGAATVKLHVDTSDLHAYIVKAIGDLATPPTGLTTSSTVLVTWTPPDTKGETLAALVRELRDERELSNDDLAEATGLSVATIGQILGGTHIPAASSLQSLADTLGVSLTQLSAAADQDKAGAEVGDEVEENEEVEAELVEASAQDEPEQKDDAPDDTARRLEYLLTGTKAPEGVNVESAAATRLLETLERITV